MKRPRFNIKPGVVVSSSGYRGAFAHDSESARALLAELEEEHPESVKDAKSIVGFAYTLTHLKQGVRPRYMRVFGTWIPIPSFYTLESLVYWKEFVKL